MPDFPTPYPLKWPSSRTRKPAGERRYPAFRLGHRRAARDAALLHGEDQGRIAAASALSAEQRGVRGVAVSDRRELHDAWGNYG